MSESDRVVASQFCKAFLCPRDRAAATHELAAHGQNAVPILRSILNGEAKNEFGVAYRRLGMPVDCSLVTICMLGRIASPLEEFVRAELKAGHAYAEDALRAIIDA